MVSVDVRRRPCMLRRRRIVLLSGGLADVQEARAAFVRARAAAAAALLADLDDADVDELTTAVLEAAALLRAAESEIAWKLLA